MTVKQCGALDEEICVFPLDIIWIGSIKKIVGISENGLPVRRNALRFRQRKSNMFWK